MARKTVPFNKMGIAGLPNNKPVVYRIQTEGGKTNYAGIAQRGQVRERIADHLASAKDAVPGTKVQIDQKGSIEAARRSETRAISRSQPKYNKQGK